ncbi:MAG TPA: hypothetical protein VFZ26_02560 [Gemmatimonadales bacterium]
MATLAVLGAAGAHLPGPGALAGFALMGPLLDLALSRGGTGWRLSGAFLAAGAVTNALAFIVRATTEDGMIGALAAVRPLAAGNDGRVVHRAGWEWPDGFAVPRPVEAIRGRGVDAVLGRRQRRAGGAGDGGRGQAPQAQLPSWRVVLYVTSADTAGRWQGLKLP